MVGVNLWQATTAHGVCEGLRITADGERVVVGEGYGYAAGQPVAGGWELRVTAHQRGWCFLHLAPSGAFIGPRQHQGFLCLAALRVENARVISLRDVRQNLCAWKWLVDKGAVAWLCERREIVVRVQGAVQVGGLWKLARAFVPFRVGQVLTPGELMVQEVVWDEWQASAAAVILETTGVTE